MRLLPARADLRWYPYAALTFLGFLAIEPLFAPVTVLEAFWTLCGTAIFVTAYFWSYWLREDRSQWVPMVIFALVGIALSSINSGANVFFFYAAYLAGWIGRPREALMGIAVLLGLIVLCYVAYDRYPVYLLSGVIVTVAVAAAGFQARTLRDINGQLARSRQQMADLARIAERERIARDLHDSLGRELTAISLKADLAKRLLSADATRSGCELDEIAHIARTALNDVRQQLAGGVQLSLETELPRAQMLLREAGVSPRVSEDGARGALDPDHETAVAYVLREAITNVVRHARASCCDISLLWRAPSSEGATLTLTIADDGVGGDASAAADGRGMGLGGMRARIGAIGGRFEWDGADGTTVRATVPVGA
ncbi:MAG: histidine kinase [Pseudomonadota bacterium]